jgi:pimeloyl-ACP methyl ester carboxylesterase
MTGLSRQALLAGGVILCAMVVAGCSGPPASLAPPNLEIDCSGEGSPTVILIPGMATPASAFESLQSSIATDTRVCSYSRAGIGDSPPWPPDEDDPSAGMAADHLRATLDEKEVRGPFVVLGWSYGGMVAQAFAQRHREMTSGLVFVDSSVRSMFTQALFGTMRVEEGGRAIDMERTRDDLADLDFGDLPTVVLTRGELDGFNEAEMARWRQGHEELAALSTNSMYLIAFDAGHAIHWDSEALVEKAVDAVVEAVRSGDPLPECDEYEWAPYTGECRGG